MTGWPDGDEWVESQHWVTEADRYDGQLAPFTALVLVRANLDTADVVLDVGCGCGAMTIEAARTSARAVGVDVSADVLGVARRRAHADIVANVEFVEADAQRHSFGAESFDAVISRFGLMFFDDPVAAFTNLHSQLRDGGRLVSVCWQGLEANPWLLVPGIAAAAHVALPPLDGPPGPRMFSLADRDTLTSVLTSAGFSTIEAEPVSPSIVLGGSGDLEDALRFLLGTGIAHTLFDGATAVARKAAIGAVRDALGEFYVPGRGVVLGTGAWLVSAVRDR